MRPVTDGAHDDLSSRDTMIDDATARGVHPVASSGNTGGTLVTYPAAPFADGSGDTKYRSVSVGSIRLDTRRSSFSAYGDLAGISAPGGGIVTVYPDDRLAQASGTSFAAPIAAGALALGFGESPKSDEYGDLSVHLEASALDDSDNRFAFGLLRSDDDLRKAMGR